MKLLSLRANKSSFHPLIFKDGINIIVGKQVAPRNENDGDKYYCTRSTNDQNKIEFCGEMLTPKAMRSKMFELCFNLPEPPQYMTWNTLFSRFVRRYRSSYATFDSFVPKESDYSKILNNCFLLGIDIDLIISKKALRDKQTAASTTEKAIKKDPVFRQYYLGKNDAELDVADLEYRIAEVEKEISEFKVSNNYHELEKEADDKSYKKRHLKTREFLLAIILKTLKDLLKRLLR